MSGAAWFVTYGVVVQRANQRFAFNGHWWGGGVPFLVVGVVVCRFGLDCEVTPAGKG
jgi:predicted ABC-type sugar transport system permease subunit